MSQPQNEPDPASQSPMLSSLRPEQVEAVEGEFASADVLSLEHARQRRAAPDSQDDPVPSDRDEYRQYARELNLLELQAKALEVLRACDPQYPADVLLKDFNDKRDELYPGMPKGRAIKERLGAKIWRDAVRLLLAADVDIVAVVAMRKRRRALSWTRADALWALKVIHARESVSTRQPAEDLYLTIDIVRRHLEEMDQPRRPVRHEADLPRQLVGANNLAEDEDVLEDWRTIIGALEADPTLGPTLLAHAETRAPSDDHRQADPGNWPYAFAIFRLSGENRIGPWLNTAKDRDMWAHLGFPQRGPDDFRPPEHTVRYHFKKLAERPQEEQPEGFRVAAWTRMHERLVERLVEHDPLIGKWVMIDATEEITTAKLVHDCGDGCPSGRGGRSLGKFAAARVPQVHIHDPATAASLRQEAVEAGLSPVGEHRAVGSGRDLVTGDIVEAHIVGTGTDRRLRFKTGPFGGEGHWYKTRDFDAGVRKYGWQGRTQKAWHGRLNMKACCAYSRIPLAIRTFSCTQNEKDHTLPIVDDLVAATGKQPETVSTDKAGTVTELTQEFNDRGIAHITPRKIHPTFQSATYDFPHGNHPHAVDRHDVWRCKHCGHETERLGYPLKDRHRYLRVKCVAGVTAKCQNEFLVLCADEPDRARAMTPLDPVYIGVWLLHSGLEGVHHQQRRQNGIAERHLDTAPAIVGGDWSHLWSQSGMALHTLRYALRRGVVPSPELAKYPVTVTQGTVERWDDRIATSHRDLMDERRRDGMHRPYGHPDAVKYGGTLLPPSRLLLDSQPDQHGSKPTTEPNDNEVEPPTEAEAS